MTSVIFSTATRYIMPLLLLFSLYILMRGHNEPGGGFVGGLVASAAFSLSAIAHGVGISRQRLLIDPQKLIACGLLTAMGSGLLPVAMGQPFLTGVWTAGELPVVGKLGTPQLFDVGVYLAVLGVVLTIVFTLAELEEEQ